MAICRSESEMDLFFKVSRDCAKFDLESQILFMRKNSTRTNLLMNCKAKNRQMNYLLAHQPEGVKDIKM